MARSSRLFRRAASEEDVTPSVLWSDQDAEAAAAAAERGESPVESTDGVPAAPGRSALFLGALRAEDDRDAPESFQVVAVAAAKVLRGWRSGALTEAQAHAELARLRVSGSDGIEWAPGATSGRWYRRVAGRTGSWALSVPPDTLDGTSYSAPGHLPAIRSSGPGSAGGRALPDVDASTDPELAAMIAELRGRP